MYAMEFRIKKSSQIKKSSTLSRCTIRVKNLQDKFDSLCYFIIPISYGEFVQKPNKIRSSTYQPSLSHHRKRRKVSTCPSDVISFNNVPNSDLPVLNVSVTNKRKVYIIMLYATLYNCISYQKGLSFVVGLHCTNIYIIDSSGTITATASKTTRPIFQVSGTYAVIPVHVHAMLVVIE